MDLNLEESQRLLLDSAREFLSLRADGSSAQMPDVLGVALTDPAQIRARWQAMSALGWPGLLIHETHGGVGAGAIEAVLLVEQMGFMAHDSPYVSSALVATTLLQTLQEGLAKTNGVGAVLESLASGASITAFAFYEAESDWTLASLQTRASVDGRITGRKLFVRDLPNADQVLVVCQLAQTSTPAVVLLPLAPLRAACMALPTLSGAPLYELRLDEVAFQKSNLLGSGVPAENAIKRALAIGAIAGAAEMVGLAQRVLDICTEHAQTRVQSGQPIGAFQAIQHHCADMLRDLEGARFITYRAAWCFDHAEDWQSLTAMAKAYASEACLAVARKGHQVMGAIGYCDEHPLQRLHKRIHALALAYGDSTAHLDALCES